MVRYSREQLQYLEEHPEPSAAEIAALPLFENHSVKSIYWKQGTLRERPNRQQARTAREELRRIRGDHPKSDLIETLPEPSIPNQTNTRVMKTDNVLIISDTHSCHINTPFLKRVLHLCLAWNITHCVVNGDVFDHAKFKTYPSRRSEPTLKEELFHVRETMRVLSGIFDLVLITLGNHDERLIVRILDNALDGPDWQLLFAQHPNVETLDFPHVFVHGEKHKTVAGHPAQYSKIPGRVPQFLHDLYPDHHVVTGHTHHVAASTKRNSIGKFHLIEGGATAMVDSFEYVAKTFKAMPMMNVGCVVVKDGYHWLLEPETPMEEMASMYQGAN